MFHELAPAYRFSYYVVCAAVMVGSIADGNHLPSSWASCAAITGAGTGALLGRSFGRPYSVTRSLPTGANAPRLVIAGLAIVAVFLTFYLFTARAPLWSIILPAAVSVALIYCLRLPARTGESPPSRARVLYRGIWVAGAVAMELGFTYRWRHWHSEVPTWFFLSLSLGIALWTSALFWLAVAELLHGEAVRADPARAEAPLRPLKRAAVSSQLETQRCSFSADDTLRSLIPPRLFRSFRRKW